jgi:hypothetical protein
MHEPGKAFLALEQDLVGAASIQELAEVEADGCHHRQQILVRFPDPLAEELDRAEDLLAETDREAERGVQPVPGRDGRPRKVLVARDLRNPDRATARPDPARKADARSKRPLPRHRLEMRHRQCGRVPETGAAQFARPCVRDPDRTDAPLEVFADGTQDARGRFGGGSGAREDLRDGALRVLATLGTLGRDPFQPGHDELHREGE